MNEEIVYVDMDNVLVDFPWGVQQLSEKKLASYEGRLDEIPDFFSNLPPIEGAIDGFKRLQQQYDTYILSTGPWNNPSAWSDKLLWVQKHLRSEEHTSERQSRFDLVCRLLLEKK